jgi:hypothetical protein
MTGTRETAAQLDTAIDTLMRVPAGPGRADEGELAATARLLRDSLPRLHPRFAFEELLASRLAAARHVGRPFAAAEPTPIRADLVMHSPAETEIEADGPVTSGERRRRGLVAGGAIASGVSLALPLAGAALVVWRRSRSSGGLL